MTSKAITGTITTDLLGGTTFRLTNICRVLDNLITESFEVSHV